MPSSGRMALGVLLFLTECAASPAGKCNLAEHGGREGVPLWFSFARESQRRELLTARSHRLCRYALNVCDFP
jgi:hypothetical protein